MMNEVRITDSYLVAHIQKARIILLSHSCHGGVFAQPSFWKVVQVENDLASAKRTSSLR